MKKSTKVGAALLVLTVSLWEYQGEICGATARENWHDVPGDSMDQTSMNDLRENRVSGENLKAFLVAYDAFKRDSDIPERKRQIENYDVEFRQDKETYTIFFFPKLKSNEERLRGGETELGKEVSYTVRKKDYKVTNRKFYR